MNGAGEEEEDEMEGAVAAVDGTGGGGRGGEVGTSERGAGCPLLFETCC